MFVHRELFGGAITAQSAPDLIDVSNIRQVPNTQEVFLYPHSNISIIVEILQSVEHSHLNDAIRFHFDSLAHDNSARSLEVESVAMIPSDQREHSPPAIVLKGHQMVPKFNHTTPDKVQILMALFRIESKHIDLIVTFNVPLEAVDGRAVNSQDMERVILDFDIFSRSLRIVDFGLFA